MYLHSAAIQSSFAALSYTINIDAAAHVSSFWQLPKNTAHKSGENKQRVQAKHEE